MQKTATGADRPSFRSRLYHLRKALAILDHGSRVELIIDPAVDSSTAASLAYTCNGVTEFAMSREHRDNLLKVGTRDFHPGTNGIRVILTLQRWSAKKSIFPEMFSRYIWDARVLS